MKIMTLVKEETGLPIFKIGVFSDEVYRKWMDAFVALQSFNQNENSKGFGLGIDI